MILTDEEVQHIAEAVDRLPVKSRRQWTGEFARAIEREVAERCIEKCGEEDKDARTKHSLAQRDGLSASMAICASAGMAAIRIREAIRAMISPEQNAAPSGGQPMRSTFCSQCGQDITAPACGPTHAMRFAEISHKYEPDARDDCRVCGFGVDHPLHDVEHTEPAGERSVAAPQDRRKAERRGPFIEHSLKRRECKDRRQAQPTQNQHHRYAVTPSSDPTLHIDIGNTRVAHAVRIPAPTPRTDEAAWPQYNNKHDKTQYIVKASSARQLERELAAANESLGMEKLLSQEHRNSLLTMCEEIAAANAEIALMKEQRKADGLHIAELRTAQQDMVMVPKELLEAFATEEGPEQHDLDKLRAMLAASKGEVNKPTERQ